MANYELRIKPSAVKDIEALPKKGRTKIIQRIHDLAADPLPSGSQKLSGQEQYRLRQGMYRVLYSIQDEALIIVYVKVAHRREAYRR